MHIKRHRSVEHTFHWRFHVTRRRALSHRTSCIVVHSSGSSDTRGEENKRKKKKKKAKVRETHCRPLKAVASEITRHRERRRRERERKEGEPLLVLSASSCTVMIKKMHAHGLAKARATVVS